MKYKILPILIIFFSFSLLEAQKVNRVFAITADNANSNPFLWMNISEVDVKSGQVTRTLFEHAKTSFELYDGAAKKTTRMAGPVTTGSRVSAPLQNPATSLVAAAAYDARHNRLFITPMHTPELRWIDLDDNSAVLKIFTAPLPLHQADLANEANHITRMVIAADGYGYALTNDANHLIRFSTGRKIQITDLGALQDAAGNGAISVHIKCSSFGGDMISDADGNLYLISAYSSVFKIDVTAKTASYTGTVKNLPAGFTANGAAVNSEGDLIVSSASPAGGYYRVDMNTWEAVKLAGGNKTPGVSDLASSHFAFRKKQPLILPAIFPDKAKSLNNISVYPNPVTEAAFRISFDNRETGRYMLQLMDVSGRMALQQPVNLLFRNQVTEIEMPAGFSKGIYMVKVLNAGGHPVYTNKILVN